METTIARNLKTGIRYAYNFKTRHIIQYIPNAVKGEIKMQCAKANDINDAYAIVRHWEILGNQ